MPVRRGELRRLAEREDETDAAEREGGVHLGDVDVALGLVGGVRDRHARQVAELHGLSARERVRAAPEMSACDAITVAIVASATSG